MSNPIIPAEGAKVELTRRAQEKGMPAAAAKARGEALYEALGGNEKGISAGAFDSALNILTSGSQHTAGER